MIFIVPCVHEIKNSSAESIQFNYAVNLLFLPLRISKVSERSLFCRESIFIPCTQLYPTKNINAIQFPCFRSAPRAIEFHLIVDITFRLPPTTTTTTTSDARLQRKQHLAIFTLFMISRCHSVCSCGARYFHKV